MVVSGGREVMVTVGIDIIMLVFWCYSIEGGNCSAVLII
jgi:hypothetical protein